MTTWNNSDITGVDHDKAFRNRLHTFTIAGISGDTGGTLTLTFTPKNVFVSAYTADAVAAGLTWRISGNTVVVAYTDPNANHTVKITVLGN